MQIEVDPQDGVTVVNISGSVDASTAPTLTRAFETALFDGTEHLIADLSTVDYHPGIETQDPRRIARGNPSSEFRICSRFVVASAPAAFGSTQ